MQRYGIPEEEKQKLGEFWRKKWADPEHRKSRVGENHANYGKTSGFTGKQHKPCSKSKMGQKSKNRAKKNREEARKRNSAIRGGVSVADAHRILDDPRTHVKIASAYNVSKTYVGDIKLRKTWHFRDD